MYGSSYEATWNDWHLYTNYIEVVPDSDEEGCIVCAPYGCDAACSQALKTPAWGSCAAPGMWLIYIWGYYIALLNICVV